MPKAQEGFQWEYDASTSAVTFCNVLPSTYMYGRERKTTYIISVRPSEVGLHVNSRGIYSSKKTQDLPGDYSLNEISAHIANMLCLSDTEEKLVRRPASYRISDILIETEIWDKRGYLANPRSFPAEMLKMIPLKIFATVGHKSYRRWMTEAFINHESFRDLPDHRIEGMFERGYFPERVHSMRGWHKLSRDNISWALRTQAWMKPNWGLFLSQCYTLHRDILSHHNEAWKEITFFMEAAIRFPKTERIHQAFESVYRYGGSIQPILDLRNVREIDTYVAACQERYEALQAIAIAQQPGLAVVGHSAQQPADLSKYTPPTISLPDGWKWATKSTFWDLGVLYNCCVNGHNYASALASDGAALLYRPVFSRKEDDRGALCYFRFSNGSWHISEIRGWSNSKILDKYNDVANSIIKKLKDAKSDEKLKAKKAKKAKRR